ncbi:MAG: threonylcarbamoyl-AMP synthase [Lachnospiraceae bacterium]|nr:threonylcarbamoyl-AMP synthase [Lachnospiraceae bacterium]
METIIRQVREDSINKEVISEASKVLQEGGIVAIPTETVYGLAGDALSSEVSHKIYEAKGRPSDNPLIVHISSVDDLYKLAKKVPEEALKLADKYWPGPLTMVLEKSELVPDTITGGLSTVAIRMPNNKIVLDLISESGIYLAAPSANTSGKPSPTTAEHVIADLSGKIDMIIDGGKVGIGIESTIVDLTSEVPVILRPGFITKKDLEEVVGDVEIDKAILQKNSNKGFVPKAPGMKYKHYAPKADMAIVLGDDDVVIDKINQLAQDKMKECKVGIIATTQTADKYIQGVEVKIVGSRENEATIANGLYSVLREFDKTDVEFIYSEGFVEDELGQAIMNRLFKAAGHNVMDLR